MKQVALLRYEADADTGNSCRKLDDWREHVTNNSTYCGAIVEIYYNLFPSNKDNFLGQMESYAWDYLIFVFER